MELSSPRFKALAVSAGFSFWFVIISTGLGIFSFETLVVFLIVVFLVMQILAVKVSRLLDIFAIYNTKLFLGILFILVISVYGIIFRVLRIDLLRLKNNKNTFWLNMELSENRILKQY